MLYVIALLTFVLAIGFWYGSTKPFLEEDDRDPSFDAAIEPLGLVLDFFKALSVGIAQKRRLPIGIYLHGLFVILTAVILIRAMILDPLGS